MLLFTRKSNQITDTTQSFYSTILSQYKGLGFTIDTSNAGGNFTWGGFTGNMIFGGEPISLPDSYSISTTFAALSGIFVFECDSKLYIGRQGYSDVYRISPGATSIVKLTVGSVTFSDSTIIKNILDNFPGTKVILWKLSSLKTNYKYKIFGYNEIDNTKPVTEIEIAPSLITVSYQSVGYGNNSGAVNTNATTIHYEFYPDVVKSDLKPLADDIEDLGDDISDLQEDMDKLNSQARSKFVSR